MSGDAPSLFDPPPTCPTCGRPLKDTVAPASVNGREITSRLAALRVFPRTGTQRRRVLAFIADRLGVGATDEEIQRGLAMSGSTERPRRGELVDGGWLTKTGETRRTLGGDDAIVWTLTDAAKASLWQERGNG